ncbi:MULTISPECIES: glycoside hydrolase family 30 beta sandwich domain-containing protein [Blautia]|uniref:glycoside hydrolase family 30 beta sandwich domain-containing protein n=1 Tax=Blautia TaxID=572511 RepID=UPI000E4D5F0F|nr:hypothetical protein DXC01_06875 [Blautia sp. OM07-19]
MLACKIDRSQKQNDSGDDRDGISGCSQPAVTCNHKVKHKIRPPSSSIEITAFEKDDKITFVILNRTDEELTAHIRLGEYCTEITVQPKSIGSGVMTEWK